ncbi:universal stress protein [Flavihumibacter profundi]|uniref:universal stress protein n=1 Tax=Flavihumibacter profundi TaxID=2716883 RepID=UPI001CC65E19|nr:universal stress protein [Flavihumibacter profundi]MBZ5858914.1 universal stress protein [Flavihumibacter profundi]
MANILVPFDFSANAAAALDQAILLAKQAKRSIIVLHITNAEVIRDYPAGWNYPAHKTDTDFIRQKLDEAIAFRKKHCIGDEPLEISGLVKESVMVNGGIINQMLLSKSELIIMGTHGATNALDRFWGSNTSTMINHAIFPVLAIPRTWQPVLFKEVLAAISLRETGRFMGNVLKWANWLQASPELVTISSIPEAEQDLADSFRKDYPAVKLHLVLKKDDLPLWRNLVQFTANYSQAVLLMFVHERTVLEKLFNYSITSRVADGVHIPLLALPTEHK